MSTVLASLTLAGVVACGGTNGVKVLPQSNNGAVPGGRSAYLDCLRSNGVNVPTGRPSGVPRPSGSRRSPMPRPSGSERPSRDPSRGSRLFPSGMPTACASLRPTGRGGDGGGGTGPSASIGG